MKQFSIIASMILIGLLFTACSSGSSSTDNSPVTDDTVTDTPATEGDGTTPKDEDGVMPDTDGSCPALTPVTHDKEIISADVKWTGKHIIKDYLTVNKLLELDKCAEIIMNEGARIMVEDGGSIKSSGTAEQHVKITSGKPVPAKGDWNAISFAATASTGNEFTYTDFIYGGQGAQGVLQFDDKTTVKIDNCTFSNIKDKAIVFEGKVNLSSFTGNSFEEVESYLVATNAEMITSLSPVTSDGKGVNRVLVDKGVIVTAGTWKNLGVNYEVKDYFEINKPIIIEAGTTVMMQPNAYINVDNGGAIKSVGTAEKKITFTSAKPAPAKGDWKDIEINEAASSENEFAYTEFKYGGVSPWGVLTLADKTTVKIDNCTFSNIKDRALSLFGKVTLSSFTGNKFEEVESYLITTNAGMIASLAPVTSDGKGVNRVLIDKGEVTEASTWKNLGVNYEVKDYFEINKPLTIEAGTTVMLQPDGFITVRDGGALKTAGTTDKKVTFTSAKDAPAKGDWKYIEIFDTASSENEFAYTNFMYGGSAPWGVLWVQSDVTVKIDNCFFKDIADRAILFQDGVKLTSFTGNSFEKIDDVLIDIQAGDVKELSPFIIDAYTGYYVLVGYGGAANGTWKKLDVPYVIKDHLYVTGSTLNIEAGTVIKMEPESFINVKDSGALKLNGISGNKVTITSSKSGPAAGDWRYIEIESTSSNANNAFTYADIMYGGGSNDWGQLYVNDGATIKLDHVTFSNGQTCDVYADGTVTNLGSNTFTACPK